MTTGTSPELQAAVLDLLDRHGYDGAMNALWALGTGPLARSVCQREGMIRTALAMLEAGNTRPQVRDRLMMRWGIGKTLAYQLIERAIDRRGQAATPGKH